MPAHLAVQAAHPIRRAAAANRQVRHVELLQRVGRVLTAKSQQILKTNAELRPGIAPEVLLDERGSKAVKPGSYRCVRRKQIARPRDRESDFKGLPGLVHKAAGTFQDGERCVTFIQVTNLRVDPERVQ